MRHRQMYRLMALTVLSMSLAVPSAAQATKADNLFRVSIVAAIAAHGADLGSTLPCVSARRCREFNPILRPLSSRPVTLGTAKMALAGTSIVLVMVLHERHPRWATVLNFAIAVGHASVAWHNTKVAQ